jgi:hypothetical protein
VSAEVGPPWEASVFGDDASEQNINTGPGGGVINGMRRTAVILTLALAAALVLWAQQRGRQNSEQQYPDHVSLEVHSLFPRETAPGQYAQVDQREIQTLADQGWELVSVMPFIYRNEEHNNGEMRGPKPVVTQTYPAYFFKRTKPNRY